ncbi:MAG TPA: DUF3108 domain-containing protein [Terriglobia bacterium]|nr:DUF3108 domain-containing protein [Terriglobia bacterium]
MNLHFKIGSIALVTLMLAIPAGEVGIQAVPQARSSKPFAPAQDASVPFHVGELLTYDISWSNTLSAGSATFAVKDKKSLAGGRSAYDIVAEAKPAWLFYKLYPLYYKLETSLDTASLLPIQGSMYSEERNRKRTKITRFVSSTSVEYEFWTSSVSRKTRIVEPMTQDPLSLFYMLRALAPTSKSPVTIPLIESGEIYRFRIQLDAHETVKTGAGTFPAVRETAIVLDAQGRIIANRKLTLWFSDDVRRIPLRMDTSLPVGTFVLSLSSVRG